MDVFSGLPAGISEKIAGEQASGIDISKKFS
jgi:hypothetical protein